MVSNFPNLPDDMFLVCQRSLENVVKLIVRDSTGQDNSLASITWHCVQYSEAVSVNSKLNKYANKSGFFFKIGADIFG